jgi:hypothetical protein
MRFRDCLRNHGIGLTSHPPSTAGRVPHAAIPADYIGTVVSPSGAQTDLWITTSAADSARAEETLNETIDAEGANESTAEAWSRGLIVGGAAGNHHSPSFTEAGSIDSCADQASR